MNHYFKSSISNEVIYMASPSIQEVRDETNKLHSLVNDDGGLGTVSWKLAVMLQMERMFNLYMRMKES